MKRKPRPEWKMEGGVVGFLIGSGRMIAHQRRSASRSRRLDWGIQIGQSMVWRIVSPQVLWMDTAEDYFVGQMVSRYA